VLHVISSLSMRLGGPSKTIELCRALAKRGVKVTVFTTNLDELGGWLPRFGSAKLLDVPLCRPVQDNGVETWYFPTPALSRFKYSPRMANELRVRIKDFALVHTHGLYLYPTMMAGRYARRFGVPYIIQPHGVLDPFMRQRHRVRKRLYGWLTEKRNLDGATAIQYTSQEEMRLASSLRLKAQGVVMPLGINVDEFSNLPRRGTYRADHPELKDARIILFMSRLAEKKGLDILIPAFASLAAANPDTRLILAGPDDDGYGTRVAEMIRRSGVGHRVTRVGMVSGQEKLALLADANMWVLPSYTENFGHAVVEAMACGLPVIISDRVNIHRSIAEADAGVVVDCDVDALAQSMQALLLDDARCRRLGAAAQQLARAEFTWERSATRLVEWYQSLVAEGSLAQAAANGPHLWKVSSH
jgi:glycosyltransferase involved in cell wall biosynthesis